LHINKLANRPPLLANDLRQILISNFVLRFVNRMIMFTVKSKDVQKVQKSLEYQQLNYHDPPNTEHDQP
jgi:hypothetical protein